MALQVHASALQVVEMPGELGGGEARELDEVTDEVRLVETTAPEKRSQVPGRTRS